MVGGGSKKLALWRKSDLRRKKAPIEIYGRNTTLKDTLPIFALVGMPIGEILLTNTYFDAFHYRTLIPRWIVFFIPPLSKIGGCACQTMKPFNYRIGPCATYPLGPILRHITIQCSLGLGPGFYAQNSTTVGVAESLTAHEFTYAPTVTYLVCYWFE